MEFNTLLMIQFISTTPKVIITIIIITQEMRDDPR
jgi:hypothetical protein